MLIILCLYFLALWLVFSKFRIVKWGWLSGMVSLLIGGFIIATFLALFNYLTPSGRMTVTGRVVEVTQCIGSDYCDPSHTESPG